MELYRAHAAQRLLTNFCLATALGDLFMSLR
jgi:hypothetical protein